MTSKAEALKALDQIEEHFRLRGGQGCVIKDINLVRSALEQPESVDVTDWQPSYQEPPYGIHTNPDARVWAKFFVDTFPQHKHMEDVMLGWFANAMMAMHDHLAQSGHLQPCTPKPPVCLGWMPLPKPPTEEQN